ncbi:hypothetical protein HK098_001902 [Nowakowskiella sp. JEL0407]|nr:hypothetical protein HK098_001902 [Nowakowskiella sp. JEL0407]
MQVLWLIGSEVEAFFSVANLTTIDLQNIDRTLCICTKECLVHKGKGGSSLEHSPLVPSAVSQTASLEKVATINTPFQFHSQGPGSVVSSSTATASLDDASLHSVNYLNLSNAEILNYNNILADEVKILSTISSECVALRALESTGVDASDDDARKIVEKLLELCKEAKLKVDAETEALSKSVEYLGVMNALKDPEPIEHEGTPKRGKNMKRKIDEKQKPSVTPKKSKQIEESPKPPPNPILHPNDKVAVRPINQDWILANVIRWVPEKQKYEVEDAEDDELEVGKRKRYLFAPRLIIPIPKEDEKRVELPVGREVLALYPNSSCFYKAEVILGPKVYRD